MEELAGRGDRLKAALFDGLVLVGLPGVLAAILVPRLSQGGFHPGQLGPIGLMLVGLWCVYIFVLLVVQVLLLHRHGQTLGKKLVRVRIVKIADGTNGGVATNVVMRVIVPGLLAFIPGINVLFKLTDILFIFRDDRRCLHDLIAGTRVVKVE